MAQYGRTRDSHQLGSGKTTAGKKDHQGVDRAYRIRGNGMASNAMNGVRKNEIAPHPRWGTPSPLLSENQRILKIFF